MRSTILLFIIGLLLTGCSQGGYQTAQTSDPLVVVGDAPVTVNQSADGKYHVEVQDATTTSKGIVQIGTGLDVAAGLVSVHFGIDQDSVAAGNDPRFTDSRAPSGASGGDLSGTYPSPSVAKIQGIPVKSGIPTAAQVLEYNATNSDWEATTLPQASSGTVTVVSGNGPISVATGTSTPVISLAKATTSTDGYLSALDWTSFNSKLSSSFILAGDLSGTLSSPTVAKIQGIAVKSGRPLAAQVLEYNSVNSDWEPTTLPTGNAGTVTSVASGTGLVGGPITSSGTLAVDVGTTASKIVQLDGLAKLPAVDGSRLTNLSVANLTGTVAYSNLPIGTTLNTVAAGNDSRFIDSRTPIGTAGGDLSGTYPNPSVANIQGRAILNTSPAGGQVLEWNSTNSDWEPTTLVTYGSVTGVTGSSPITVTSSSTTPQVSLANGTTSGQSLRWNGFTWSITSLKYTDLVNSMALSPWPPTTCTSGQGMTWSSISDSFSCTTLSIATSQLTGIILAAQMPAFTGDVTSTAGSLALALAASGVTAGTYNQVTVDTKGRVTAATNQTTLSGYGITDAIKNAGNAVSIQSGADSSKPTAGTVGRIYLATDTQKIYEDLGSSWSIISNYSSGTMTSVTAGAGLSGGTITTTGTISLPTTGTAGTYTKVTTDAYGRVSTGSALTASDIPVLDASKITTGVFTAAQIPFLDASKIITGTFTASQIPLLDASQITTGTFTTAEIPSLDASKITTGVFSPSEVTATNCTAGQALTKISGVFSCVTPTLSGTASGDLSGTYPSPTVSKLQGVNVSSATPTSGQLLAYNGTAWTPTNEVGIQNSQTVSLGTSMTAAANTIYLIATAGSYTLNLPCSLTTGSVISVRNLIATSGFTVTVTACAGENFDFAPGSSITMDITGSALTVVKTADATRQWSLTGQVELGIMRCPTGMTLAGAKPGAHNSVCIDSSDQTATDFYSAVAACQDRGIVMCSPNNWFYACRKGVSGLPNSTDWVDIGGLTIHGQTAEGATVGGSGSCTTNALDILTNSNNYRCCIQH